MRAYTARHRERDDVCVCVYIKRNTSNVHKLRILRSNLPPSHRNRRKTVRFYEPNIMAIAPMPEHTPRCMRVYVCVCVRVCTECVPIYVLGGRCRRKRRCLCVIDCAIIDTIMRNTYSRNQKGCTAKDVDLRSLQVEHQIIASNLGK